MRKDSIIDNMANVLNFIRSLIKESTSQNLEIHTKVAQQKKKLKRLKNKRKKQDEKIRELIGILNSIKKTGERLKLNISKLEEEINKFESVSEVFFEDGETKHEEDEKNEKRGIMISDPIH